MSRPQCQGKCEICGKTFSKSSFTRHLKSCVSKSKPAAAKKSNAGSVHIVVEEKYGSHYWLHIEAGPQATLADLDDYLRNIWLECCGHMSAFENPNPVSSRSKPNSANYGSMQQMFQQMMEQMVDGFGDDDRDLDFNALVHEALPSKQKVNYTYDFGSSTNLTVKAVNQVENGVKGNSIRLLARNDAPEVDCIDCGKPATEICTDCCYIGLGEGLFCKKCLNKHECGDEMALPLVNSPRAGVCGYAG